MRKAEGIGYGVDEVEREYETAKLNDVNPQAWLNHFLGRIADHPINRIEDLAPWNLRN